MAENQRSEDVGQERGSPFLRWSALAEQQPKLAALAEEKLIRPGVLLVGTVRRDGSARISGVEPLVMEGDLWLSMMRGSAKALDLHRDRRISLNSIITGPEPAVEIKLRAMAALVTEPAVHEGYAAKVAVDLGWQSVVGRFDLFRVNIVGVTQIGYDPDTRGQHVARWPERSEYIRPATSPTSLGSRQPVRRLLQ